MVDEKVFQGVLGACACVVLTFCFFLVYFGYVRLETMMAVIIVIVVV